MMALRDWLCCGMFAAPKEGLTDAEKNTLQIAQLRSDLLEELIEKMKRNNKKTEDFFNSGEKFYKRFSTENMDLSAQRYAEVLATRENRKVAIDLAKRYQAGDEDAIEIIDSMGSHISAIKHPEFQQMIKGKDIVVEASERSSLLKNH
jgi:hypothetical protein